jgi:hypothetical protein
MTAHTPGPWLLVEQGDANEYVIVTPDKKEWVVAFRLNPGYPVYTQEIANARLISVAPELLESLQQCVTAMKVVTSSAIIPFIERAEAVIKKATL